MTLFMQDTFEISFMSQLIRLVTLNTICMGQSLWKTYRVQGIVYTQKKKKSFVLFSLLSMFCML